MSEQQQPATQFALHRIYVKDLSFESPASPESFTKQWNPTVNLEINTHNEKIAEDSYEVVLSITVTAKAEDGAAIYLVEVQQAGIFLLKGLEDEQLKQMLGAYCPNILFPYAREAADSVVTKGSFPPLMLAPVNFDAIYAQARARAEAEGATIQ